MVLDLLTLARMATDLTVCPCNYPDLFSSFFAIGALDTGQLTDRIIITTAMKSFSKSFNLRATCKPSLLVGPVHKDCAAASRQYAFCLLFRYALELGKGARTL